ncbi:MAG: reverse transcriptase domain-containing protein [Chloroflexota bacterium]
MAHSCNEIEARHKAHRSQLLANLFLHYAFDVWIGREFPDLQFERYCDDVVVHCASEQQAQVVRDAIAERLAQCGLEMHL